MKLHQKNQGIWKNQDNQGNCRNIIFIKNGQDYINFNYKCKINDFFIFMRFINKILCQTTFWKKNNFVSIQFYIIEY